jgi:hypothetical protein
MTETIDLEDFLSVLYHALRARRRRYVIQLMKDNDGRPLTTRELARQVTSLEEEVPTPRATGEPYRNAYNALTQTHLPTLSDAGIIIYDPDRQISHSGPHFPIAALLLDTNTPTVDVLSSLSDQSDTGQ